MDDYAIGIDLGGTHIRAALVRADGTLHAQHNRPTPASAGVVAVVHALATATTAMHAALPPGATLRGVGVGAPGSVNVPTGVVLTAVNLPGWHDVPLRDALTTATGLPVRLTNDAAAALYGEWYYGGGKGYSHLLYVTVSTGIGAGVISNGHPLAGTHGTTSEAGQMIINLQSRTTWEELASGTALARAARTAMPTNPASLLHRMASAATVTAVHVARAAQQGDPLARSLLHRLGYALGVGVLNLLYLFHPQRVLLGGGVIRGNPWLLPTVRHTIQRYALNESYQQIPVELAPLGVRAGVLGAASLHFAPQPTHSNDPA